MTKSKSLADRLVPDMKPLVQCLDAYSVWEFRDWSQKLFDNIAKYERETSRSDADTHKHQFASDIGAYKYQLAVIETAINRLKDWDYSDTSLFDSIGARIEAAREFEHDPKPVPVDELVALLSSFEGESEPAARKLKSRIEAARKAGHPTGVE